MTWKSAVLRHGDVVSQVALNPRKRVGRLETAGTRLMANEGEGNGGNESGDSDGDKRNDRVTTLSWLMAHGSWLMAHGSWLNEGKLVMGGFWLLAFLNAYPSNFLDINDNNDNNNNDNNDNNNNNNDNVNLKSLPRSVTKMTQVTPPVTPGEV